MNARNRDTSASIDEFKTPKALNAKVEEELRGGFNIGPHFEKLRQQYPQEASAKIVSSVLVEQ